ncbi:hypothetical protein [Actinotalea sp.]|uniref:hypothetical protein n=1 Tax=Actinotalea sp. TaxID=1872145 RepID=UPI0035662F8A
MATKHDLRDWTIEALKSLGGSGSVVETCRLIWQVHEPDLRASGDLFYTWQYDVRWAAQTLRDEGVLVSAGRERRAPWTLA